MRPYDVSELEAYVDGELDAVRRAELAAWLSRNPDAQAVAETLRYQNAGLHAVFGKLLHKPVPERLRTPLARPRSRNDARVGHLPLIWVVAGGLLLFASALIGWLAHGYSFGRPAQDDQLAAHLEQMQEAAAFCTLPEDLAEGLGGAADSFLISLAEDAPLGPAAAADRRLRLVEARVLPGQEGLSAVFSFADETGSHLSLYIQRSELEEEQAPRLVERDGISYFLWSEGPLTCTLVAPATI